MADALNDLITDHNAQTPEIDTLISKVPEVTIVFWIIKILCTSVGEIGADALTMSYFGETTENVSPFWHEYGYLIGAAIFLVIFLIAVGVQIFSRRFHPIIYWTTISVFAAMGAGGVMAPALAAWAPNLLFGAGAAYLLLTVRT